MRFQLALTMLAAAVLAGAQSRGIETVVDNRWDGRVLQQKVVVSPSEFNVAWLQRLFGEIQARNSPLPLVKVEVFTSRKADSGDFKGGCELTYGPWRDLFDKYKANVPASAQFISIGGNSAMKVRDEAGRIYTAVLSGKDPAVLTVGGATLHLADVISRTIIGRDGRPTLTSDFYYWSSDGYTESTALAAWRELTRSTGLRNVTVYIERWPWFILAGGFPVFYPYAPSNEVPSEEQYVLSRRVWCGSQYGPSPVCWAYGQKP